VWVNAGAGAVRVVVGLEVPPLGALAGGVVLVGVVVLERVCVRGVVVVVVLCTGGALAMDTVFVPPPQPASSATKATPRPSVSVERKLRLMILMIFAVGHAPPHPTFLLVTANLLKKIVSTR
jgi:hypothetical protein